MTLALDTVNQGYVTSPIIVIYKSSYHSYKIITSRCIKLGTSIELIHNSNTRIEVLLYYTIMVTLRFQQSIVFAIVFGGERLTTAYFRQLVGTLCGNLIGYTKSMDGIPLRSAKTCFAYRYAGITDGCSYGGIRSRVKIVA